MLNLQNSISGLHGLNLCLIKRFQFVTAKIDYFRCDISLKVRDAFMLPKLLRKLTEQITFFRKLCVHIETSSLWAEFVNKNRCISVRLVTEEVKSITF